MGKQRLSYHCSEFNPRNICRRREQCHHENYREKSWITDGGFACYHGIMPFTHLTLICISLKAISIMISFK